MFELEHFCAKTKGEWFKMCYFDIEYHENFDWITETTLFLVVWRHVNQSNNYSNPFCAKNLHAFLHKAEPNTNSAHFCRHKPMK